MKQEKLMNEPIPLSFPEEVWNALLHGLMVLAILASLPFLSVYRYLQQGWLAVTGLGVYLLCISAMFFFSTLYHSMPYHTVWKTVTRKLDHIAILLAIAGTYTPVCLAMEKPAGYWLLAIEWILVSAGILLKAFAKKSYPVVSITLYLAMGWMAVIFWPWLAVLMTPPFLFWMLAGGVLYTIGIYFYSIHKRYYHVIWHVVIVLAFACQFVAIVFYL